MKRLWPIKPNPWSEPETEPEPREVLILHGCARGHVVADEEAPSGERIVLDEPIGPLEMQVERVYKMGKETHIFASVDVDGIVGIPARLHRVQIITEMFNFDFPGIPFTDEVWARDGSLGVDLPLTFAADS